MWPAGQPTTTVTTTGGNAAATVALTGGAPVVGDMPAQTAPPTTANLNAWLNNFYNAEAKRKSTFPSSLPADAQPFLMILTKHLFAFLVGYRSRRVDVASTVVAFRY
ncbi:cellulose biosynthesis protein BcsG [Escherichia coli]